MSEPCESWVVGSEPLRSNSTSTSVNSPLMRSRARRPMRSAAAQWELDGPRITGPITSLKMLTSNFELMRGRVSSADYCSRVNSYGLVFNSGFILARLYPTIRSTRALP